MDPQLKDLSDRQKSIYKFICTTIAEKGVPPTVREICSAEHLKSTSTVHSHITRLETLGYIKHDSQKSRSMTVTKHNFIDSQKLNNENSTFLNPKINEVSAQYSNIPLVGKVAAGTPVLAEENIEETIAIPQNILGDKGSFVLQVRGESMIEAGILNGDYLVVQETNEATDGQIVVALIGDSATVKTFYREKNRIRLQPENKKMDPIYASDPKILGLVTGVIRSLN